MILLSELAYHDFLHHVQKVIHSITHYLEVCVGDFDGKFLRTVDFL